MLKRLRNSFNKFMDWYLKYTILKDLLLIAGVWLLAYRLPFFEFSLIDKANQINILSSIIGASVSLAGFLIAALTILVTYKLTVKAGSVGDANSPTELIFLTRHYYKMMAVFRDAIIELLVGCLGLYVIWASSENVDITIINRAVVIGIILIALPIFRSLALLFRLLSLDKSTELNRQLIEED